MLAIKKKRKKYFKLRNHFFGVQEKGQKIKNITPFFDRPSETLPSGTIQSTQ